MRNRYRLRLMSATIVSLSALKRSCSLRCDSVRRLATVPASAPDRRRKTNVRPGTPGLGDRPYRMAGRWARGRRRPALLLPRARSWIPGCNRCDVVPGERRGARPALTVRVALFENTKDVRDADWASTRSRLQLVGATFAETAMKEGARSAVKLTGWSRSVRFTGTQLETLRATPASGSVDDELQVSSWRILKSRRTSVTIVPSTDTLAAAIPRRRPRPRGTIVNTAMIDAANWNGQPRTNTGGMQLK